jgi:UDP-3-O-[3-hydroxymyristoyl] N-acetylglucosamine deacetylase
MVSEALLKPQTAGQILVVADGCIRILNGMITRSKAKDAEVGGVWFFSSLMWFICHSLSDYILTFTNGLLPCALIPICYHASPPPFPYGTSFAVSYDDFLCHWIPEARLNSVDYRQRTIRNEVSCTGIGLHSGHPVNLTIKPAPPDYGITFTRKDIPSNPVIKAHFDSVVDTNLSTTIGKNGFKVSTVEHLMAAFFGLGIDNARVELDGPEVPIMDGSAGPFVFLLKSAGIKELKRPKRFIVVREPFEIRDGGRSISLCPSKELKISYTIDFNHPLLRDQSYELRFSGKDFVKEISRARTFGFLRDIETLRENGLAMGGSLDNAVVVDDFRILNEDGLRYKDEFVRHKILDFLGDLAMLGCPVIGHFAVHKSGHSLNQRMLKKLVRSSNHWENLVVSDPRECVDKSVNIPVFGHMDPVRV